MTSPQHASAILSAAPDVVGIGVAVDKSHNAWVIELFGTVDHPAFAAGQGRLAAELASNGVPRTEYGQSFTGFPTEPIVAGTENRNAVFATGVDWLATGPSYRPGPLLRARAVAVLPSGTSPGAYRVFDAAGGVRSFGGLRDGPRHSRPVAPVVGATATSDGRGYLAVSATGTLARYGEAASIRPLARPPASHVVGIALSPGGHGAWLAEANGTVLCLGNAKRLESGGRLIGGHVVAIAASRGPRPGYWLATSTGTVVAFGAAPVLGSARHRPPTPVVALAVTPDGRGYWLATTRGAALGFGDARFFGSTSAEALPAKITAIAGAPLGAGYFLLGATGIVYPFGVARFSGSA